MVRLDQHRQNRVVGRVEDRHLLLEWRGGRDGGRELEHLLLLGVREVQLARIEEARHEVVRRRVAVLGGSHRVGRRVGSVGTELAHRQHEHELLGAILALEEGHEAVREVLVGERVSERRQLVLAQEAQQQRLGLSTVAQHERAPRIIDEARWSRDRRLCGHGSGAASEGCVHARDDGAMMNERESERARSSLLLAARVAAAAASRRGMLDARWLLLGPRPREDDGDDPRTRRSCSTDRGGCRSSCAHRPRTMSAFSEQVLVDRLTKLNPSQQSIQSTRTLALVHVCVCVCVC